VKNHHEVCSKLCVLFDHDDRVAMFPKKSVDFHQIIRCYVPDNRTVGHIFMCLLLGEGMLSCIL
jgi:hypothetical protein